MTVCAAAICQYQNEPIVIGIADRMYTKQIGQNYGQYESRTSKIYRFCRNVVGWGAMNGDYGLQIAQMTRSRLAERGITASDPAAVVDVATMYAEGHITVRNRKVTSHLLAHLGLDLESFTGGRHGLPPSVVSETIEKMRQKEMDLQSDALIFGVDSAGPHIYRVVDPGEVLFDEKPGFLSIGSGSEQFDAAFMAAKYYSGWPMVDALLLAFSAKRQAELAWGVGKTTDIVIVRETGHRFLTTDQIRTIAGIHTNFTQDIDGRRMGALVELTHALPELP